MGRVMSLRLIGRDNLYFMDPHSLSPCYNLSSPLPFIHCLSKPSHRCSDDFFQWISLLEIIWFAEFPFRWAISLIVALEDFIVFGIRMWRCINTLFLHGPSADQGLFFLLNKLSYWNTSERGELHGDLVCLVLLSKWRWPRWSEFTGDFGHVAFESSGAKNTKGKKRNEGAGRVIFIYLYPFPHYAAISSVI